MTSKVIKKITILLILIIDFYCYDHSLSFIYIERNWRWYWPIPVLYPPKVFENIYLSICVTLDRLFEIFIMPPLVHLGVPRLKVLRRWPNFYIGMIGLGLFLRPLDQWMNRLVISTHLPWLSPWSNYSHSKDHFFFIIMILYITSRISNCRG